MVTEYFERPCSEYREGRRLVMAANKIIYPEEGYPRTDHDGVPLDEPLLHRLSYLLHPGGDGDKGLVRHIIDLQRTFNDAINKQLEIKNLALNLQILAPRGSLKERRVTTPGAIIEWDPVPGGAVPTFQEPPNPQLLAQLQSIAESARADAGYIADA